jgi:hypothetical protein
VVKLSQEDIAKIKDLHQSAVDKLTESLERTVEGEVGMIVNIEAPTLIRAARVDIGHIRHIIEKAEDAAARAGEINKPKVEEAPALENQGEAGSDN